jgi:hypothetical protein
MEAAGSPVADPGLAAGPVLRDPALDQALRDDGYVVLPVLPPEAVAWLADAQQRLVPEGDDGLAVDYMRPDRATMRTLWDLVEPVWDEHLSAVFADHQRVMTTFVVKHPGHESGMFLHEDRTYVDERHARAHTLWIPLTDVGPGLENGTLEIVPRSHHLATTLGGSNTPELFRPYERHLRERLVPLDVAAGSAVVYDTRTLHASGPNLSDRPRIALVCAVAPRGEPLIHVRASGPTRRRVHHVTPAFFVEHHPREIEASMPADCPVVREYDDDTGVPSPATVAAALGGPMPVPDPVVPDDLRRPEDPPGLPVLRTQVGTGRRSGARRSQVAVTLGPGERRTFASRRRRRPEVAVVSGPALGAGVRSGPAAADLAPDQRAWGGRGHPVTLWNEGPGPCAFLVRGVVPVPSARP